MLPKISIITPSLNQGRFLRECLDSIFAQRYPALEVLVADGGSTDDSPATIGEYAHRLAWHVSERDEGQSHAINKALRHCTGDLVSWLNADDFLLPGALAAVARTFEADPAAPFYYGNGQRVDEQGRRTADFFRGGTPPFSRDALAYGLNYILQPATFVRREAWTAAGPLDETLRWGMDTDLWLRLASLGHPAAVDAVLAASREYGETKTASGMFERIEELRRIAQRHTGAAITPGVLCYFADTLHRYAASREDLFGPRYGSATVEPFWARTAELMRRFGAGPDGMPDPGAAKR